MKLFSLLLLFTLSISTASAKLVDGYIITLQNDTQYLKIKVPGAFSNFNYKEVETRDSILGDRVFTLDSIKGYAFRDKDQDYIYRSKKIKNGKLYFLEEVKGGKNTSLYQYISPAWTYGSNHIFYTFQKSDGTTLFIDNFASLSDFKTELGIFYRGNKELDKLIDSKFNGRRHIQNDINEIIDAANALP